MGITKAFIEENGNGRMESEMRDVCEELRHRNIPVELFVAKRIHRRQLLLARDTLVVGYVPSLLAAFKMLGIEPPITNDYPPILRPFYHRRIWESTVQQLIASLYADGTLPIFAKPKDKKKRFTGRIFTSPVDLRHLEGASKRTQIFCSEVVEWVTEYRVFVAHGNIVGTKHYAGDPSRSLDESIVNEGGSSAGTIRGNDCRIRD